MKKLLALLLALSVALSLCACGNFESEEEKERKEDIEEKIRITVQAKATVEVDYTYGAMKSVMASVSSTNESEDSVYDVCGYVTVIDKNEDTYKAKYDATVSIDEDGETYCWYFDMDTPRKLSR